MDFLFLVAFGVFFYRKLQLSADYEENNHDPETFLETYVTLDVIYFIWLLVYCKLQY